MNDTEWMEEIIKYQSQLRIIDEEMQLLNKMLETAEGSLLGKEAMLIWHWTSFCK